MPETLLCPRNLAFELYEVLDAEALTQRERFAEHSRETFNAAVDTARSIAENLFAPHNRKADENEPIYKDGEAVLIPEVKPAVDAFIEAGFHNASRSFEDGVDRVATIATEKTRAVKMSLDKDRITLSVTSPENGTAAEEVPGAFQGEGFDIGFNARYLLDILGQIDSDLVELHLADAAAPTLIRESDASPALYVLMPMRV